ncbi:rho GTPase-activating protein 29-like isoform X2 [Limulus polyphemus]|uniref:Rho GTPase-activating protein 29-like isoform X2 n=2 Tax=Limulus polyphemus TaxID=6850 RepID=A0ABM1RXP7_LIMPO|nr:rho GTPase-activating protein 29-like isoform X2 [Limulus polyphemus]
MKFCIYPIMPSCLPMEYSDGVSDYIMGDLDSRQSQKDESSENLLSSGGVSNQVYSQEKGPKSPVLSPEDIDLKLLATEDGVSHALRRAKLWSKYAKDVVCYVEKKTSLGQYLSWD